MMLEEIFNNCDHYADKWQPYFEIYERHLDRFRGRDITIVEIGVQGGGSLEMWGKYFGPAAKIVGIDIDPNCANLTYDNPNIQVIIGDQESPDFWDAFSQKFNSVDIIIDDGGHVMNQQIVSFEKMFPQLNLGGVYICEDCHTSYWQDYDGGLHNPKTFIEYAKTYIDVLHFDWMKQHHPEFIRRATLAEKLTDVCFYDSMVVFEKCGKRPMHRVFPYKFEGKGTV